MPERERHGPEPEAATLRVAIRRNLGPFNSVGWSLGSECPYACTHCYSRSMRVAADHLTPAIVDRIVNELAEVGVRTVTLGGNEPIYTNGRSLAATQLPRIVRSLRERDIAVALVTSGPSATLLQKIDPGAFASLDMVFVSLDAPTPQRHDESRGAKLFSHALRALSISVDVGVDRAILYCAHQANFAVGDVDLLVALALRTRARLRINTLKPVGTEVDRLVLDHGTFLAGFARLIELCRTDLVDEPVLRALLGLDARHGCPCGVTTFRVSHARIDGSIPIAPCIYAADDRVGDLRTDRLRDILQGPAFARFAARGCHPDGSPAAAVGGGCAALASATDSSLRVDPMADLVHRGLRIDEAGIREDAELRRRYGGYLCTWFGSCR